MKICISPLHCVVKNSVVKNSVVVIIKNVFLL
jgi:hypothetical protein